MDLAEDGFQSRVQKRTEVDIRYTGRKDASSALLVRRVALFAL